MDYLLATGGLLLLFFGGEKLIQGSVAVAERLGLSTLLVSMVVIGFGTSTPELLVSLQAALKGSPDIAIGNVVGSNICNVLLILGVAAVITPVACGKPAIRRDAAAVAVASVALAALSLSEAITRPAGFCLLAALVIYLLYCLRCDKERSPQERREDQSLEKHIHAEMAPPKQMSLGKAAGLTLLGLAVLIVGADLLVSGAVSIARTMHISEAVIGLTLVAVGTSLPELATAIIAARRRHGDVVIGNVLGSNLFNALGILGITSLVAPLRFSERIAAVDVWVMLATAVALLLLAQVRGEMGRRLGMLSILCYGAYLASLV